MYSHPSPFITWVMSAVQAWLVAEGLVAENCSRVIQTTMPAPIWPAKGALGPADLNQASYDEPWSGLNQCVDAHFGRQPEFATGLQIDLHETEMPLERGRRVILGVHEQTDGAGKLADVDGPLNRVGDQIVPKALLLVTLVDAHASELRGRECVDGSTIGRGDVSIGSAALCGPPWWIAGDSHGKIGRKTLAKSTG